VNTLLERSGAACVQCSIGQLNKDGNLTLLHPLVLIFSRVICIEI